MVHPFLDHPGPIAIAHRGGSLEAEENTRAAFAHAVGLGFTHVELDVHATTDGEVVIHHDPTLARLCDDPRAIAQMTWAELRSVRTKGGQGIPRLVELLDACPDLFINIEAKSDRVVAPLARLIRPHLARLCVGSFAPQRTAALRAELGPGLCWSPAHRDVAMLWARGWGLPLPMAGFPVIQVPLRWRGIDVVTPRLLQAAHRAGVKVQVWTVDDPAQMTRLIDMGVDGLMTDRPSVLRDLLALRGAWAQSAPKQGEIRC
jgi:glycerophosphoryl diester phosphodiesterase